jgi:hypothetical protein
VRSKYSLVLVEWEDGQRPLAPWRWVDEFHLPTAVHCLTVGLLIAKTEAALVPAPSLGDIDQDASMRDYSYSCTLGSGLI